MGNGTGDQHRARHEGYDVNRQGSREDLAPQQQSQHGGFVRFAAVTAIDAVVFVVMAVLVGAVAVAAVILTVDVSLGYTYRGTRCAST